MAFVRVIYDISFALKKLLFNTMAFSNKSLKIKNVPMDYCRHYLG